MKKQEFLEKVGEAYPGAFPADRDQALAHEIGDTLADFVYLELDENLPDEVLEGDEADAIRVMEMARDDINAVLHFLNNNLQER